MIKLFATYIGLMALLVLTVLASHWNLGPWQTPTALAIAVAKTLLVALVFMELGTSPAIIRWAAAAGLLWIFFFYALGASDVGWRVPIPGSSWL